MPKGTPGRGLSWGKGWGWSAWHCIGSCCGRRGLKCDATCCGWWRPTARASSSLGASMGCYQVMAAFILQIFLFLFLLDPDKAFLVLLGLGLKLLFTDLLKHFLSMRSFRLLFLPLLALLDGFLFFFLELVGLPGQPFGLVQGVTVCKELAVVTPKVFVVFTNSQGTRPQATPWVRLLGAEAHSDLTTLSPEKEAAALQAMARLEPREQGHQAFKLGSLKIGPSNLFCPGNAAYHRNMKAVHCCSSPFYTLGMKLIGLTVPTQICSAKAPTTLKRPMECIMPHIHTWNLKEWTSYSS